MELKPETLLIFLFAVLPGAVARRAKNALVPRSLETPTAVSEIGDYVLTSAWIHFIILSLFRVIIPLLFGKLYLASVLTEIRQGGFGKELFFDHWELSATYFLVMVISAYFFGILRGYQIRTKRFQKSLFKRFGLTVTLEKRTLWNVIMDGDDAEIFDTWLEVELKDGKGFYQGRLKTYAIVADNERNKEFYLKPASFKEKRGDKYEPLPQAAGVLLTFDEVLSIRVARLKRPTTETPKKAAAAVGNSPSTSASKSLPKHEA